MSREDRQPKGGTARNVTDEEQVVFETRLHWITAAAAFVLPALFAAGLLLYEEAFGLDPEEVSVAIIIALIGVVMSAGRMGMIAYSRFSVTTERITFRDIQFGLATQEIFLSQIERVDLVQDAFGFMLGYGHLRILLTTGDLQYFYWISQPIEFREYILDALEASREAA